MNERTLIERLNIPWPEHETEDVTLPAWVIELCAEGAARITALEAQLADLAAENERLKQEIAATQEKLIRANDELIQRNSKALSRTGGVKPLDEDDYEEIISAAAINMRKATSGIRGQMITVQDSLDWWVMKETEQRILSALETAEEAASRDE